MEQSRPSGEPLYIASDVGLGESSYWWTQSNTPPPAFQNRRDILYEIEESSSSQGGKTTITKDVYVLFHDYSQTVITAQFDARNPADVVLSQRHESPPSTLRQDQLEEAHTRFGQRLAEAVVAKQNTIVGNSEPHALVLELLKQFPDVLYPVGVRAYGALVYANLANASFQQFDEIRPGDVITLRNAKFQGHRGPMHQKYTMEVGKPDHVGVVVDWDGTKKKVRAWEQGRESKKVKIESFKLGDLRSGEIKVWRVMGRSWVGWQAQSSG
jgi:myosin tail region-interacting protein MTI1